LELAHVLTNSIRDLDRNYQVSRTTFNRRVAAMKQVQAVKASYEVGTATLDMLLDAQRRLADAEIAYYRALVDYNVAILQVHYRKNSLLEYDGIHLAEGPWPAKAYFDARKRARERDSAHYINYGFTRPDVLSRGPMPQTMNQAGQPFDEMREEDQPNKANQVGDGAESIPPGSPANEPASLPPLDEMEPGDGQPTDSELRGPPPTDSSAMDDEEGIDSAGDTSSLDAPEPPEPSDGPEHSSVQLVPADGGWRRKMR
jgi:hypothetical protein